MLIDRDTLEVYIPGSYDVLDHRDDLKYLLHRLLPLLVKRLSHLDWMNAICIAICLSALVTVSGVGNARAEDINKCGPTDTRGIWYDIPGAGLDPYPKTTRSWMEETIDKFKRLCIKRIHIVINDPVTATEVYSTCLSDERRKNPAATKKQVREIGWGCAYNLAKNKVFALDRWVVYDNNRASLQQFVSAAKAADMDIVFTIWPYPTDVFFDSVFKKPLSKDNDLLEMIRENKPYGIELEDESNWSQRYMQDLSVNLQARAVSTDLNGAADLLLKDLRAAVDKVSPKTKIGVTVSPRDFIQKSFVDDVLFRNADFISFQAYQDVCSWYNASVWSCNSGLMSGKYAPGNMEDKAIEVVSKLGLSKTELIIGLPAYQQGANYILPEENMYVAAKAAICHSKNVNRIGDTYWSANNITEPTPGRPRRSIDFAHIYAVNFLTNCQMDKISTHCRDGSEDLTSEMLSVCPGLDKRWTAGQHAAPTLSPN